MPRDDFLEPVKKSLAERVGYRCSNPTCRKLTSRPHPTKAAEVIRAGVAAHITAASPGGPRFDLALSPEERTSAENGIWLCETCARVIDGAAADIYPKELLRHWRQDAERSAAVAARTGPDVIAEVQAAIDLARGTVISFAARWQADEPIYAHRPTTTEEEWEEENRAMMQYGIGRLAAFGTEVAPLVTAAVTKAAAVLVLQP
jgi:hypothetical protein